MHIARLLIDRRIDDKCPDGHPCHMLLPIKMVDGIRVEVIQCSYLSDGAGYSLVKITDNDSDYRESDIVGTHHSLMGECSVMKTGKDQYLATILNNNCKLATILSESGCFLTSAVPRNDYIIEWILIAPNSIYITNLIERMRSEGYGTTKIASELLDADMVLTTRQEEIIDYAYENGYYDSPKGININDLCDKFDCSKSTMSVILKGAEKKIIGNYLCINRNNQYH